MVDSIKCISHVKLDQHPILFPLFAGMDSFLHLDDVVQDVSAFDEPPLGIGYEFVKKGFNSICHNFRQYFIGGVA